MPVQNDQVNAECQMKQRWNLIVEPGHQATEAAFSRLRSVSGSNRRVLNCAVPLGRARQLTDFTMPPGLSVDKCLVTSGSGSFPPGWLIGTTSQKSGLRPSCLKWPLSPESTGNSSSTRGSNLKHRGRAWH